MTVEENEIVQNIVLGQQLILVEEWLAAALKANAVPEYPKCLPHVGFSSAADLLFFEIDNYDTNN